MTTFRSTDISVTEAIRDIILDLNITPQTDLSQDAQIGDAQTYVVDPTVFGPGQLFTIYDDMGEEDLPIASDWDGTNPVRFNLSGMEYSGFRFAHVSGARAGTNLFTEVPNNIDNMLLGQWPLVYIVNLDQKDVIVAGHQIEPVFAMHIEYRRALIQPGTTGQNANTGMNTNVWGMRAQRLCRLDMEQIAKTIRDNQTLSTHKGENAMALGDPLNPQKERFAKTWNKIIVDPNTQHFAAMGDFSVRGFREVFFGDAFGAA